MIDLMGKKNIFFAFSILLFLTGIIGLLINGVELDIQFQGGTIMQIEMSNDQFDTERAADIVMESIGKKANVQKSSTYNLEEGKNNIYLMVLNIASDETLNENERSTVLTALRKEFNISEDAEITINSVEPFIGKEITLNAMYATILSSILIILYVWWRFRVMNGLSAGVFAILALVHDCYVMFAFYVVFKLPLNDSFVAALLTIIGFSINDTIVIYDRIRENTRLMRKSTPIHELVNKSVLQSISRSINTSLMALTSVIVLYVFSAIYNIQALREFSLPMAVGLISGVYSTIFIASPLYMVWQERNVKKKAARKAVRA